MRGVARLAASALVTGLTFASFAGCTPDKSSSHSASAACAPAAARITWDAVQESPFGVLVGRTLWARAKDGRLIPRTQRLAIPGSFDKAALSTLVALGGTAREWQSVLLISARATGDVDSDFGTSLPTMPDGYDAPLADGANVGARGILISILSTQATKNFSADCPGVPSVKGSVTGLGQKHWTTTFDCSSPSARRSDSFRYCTELAG